MNIPDELRDEIIDVDIGIEPEQTSGNQEYDETTFHNLTGLWFPGSANESRTRDARRMDMEINLILLL